MLPWSMACGLSCGSCLRNRIAAANQRRSSSNEPSSRAWDPELAANPWLWLHDQIAGLGAGPGRKGWPLEPGDAGELSTLADAIVALARELGPDRCRSASECFALTRDARESVQLMIRYLLRPDLLDVDWVSPWMARTRC
jgi:hypothetical protein